MCKQLKILISVICHGHDSLIIQLNCLSLLAQSSDIEVILKNNLHLVDESIIEYCRDNDIHLLDEEYGLGFGDNNNYVFNYAINNLGIKDDDYFLILNPDVYVDVTTILDACELARNQQSELSTINLFKDEKLKEHDLCVRSFPSLIDFFFSYVGFGNQTIIDKSSLSEPTNADWAAGSFLLFKTSLYRELGGFDPLYFMYCEDIDICWRSQNLFNQKLLFIPDLKAIHHAKHANRTIFSRHFFWHVKSMLRYLTLLYGLRKPYKK